MLKLQILVYKYLVLSIPTTKRKDFCAQAKKKKADKKHILHIFSFNETMHFSPHSYLHKSIPKKGNAQRTIR